MGVARPQSPSPFLPWTACLSLGVRSLFELP